MIKEQIDRLVSTLQALTQQHTKALLEGKRSEAQQIQSVAIDVDAKIQELERAIRSSSQACSR